MKRFNSLVLPPQLHLRRSTKVSTNNVHKIKT